jgi:hypothetical protein
MQAGAGGPEEKVPDFLLHWHLSLAEVSTVPRGMGFGFRDQAAALEAIQALALQVARRDGLAVIQSGEGVWRVGHTIYSVVSCNARCPLRPLISGGDPGGDSREI